MVYVLSDIHGSMENWQAILTQIQLRSEDELYVLGDVVDRNPDGLEILQQIIDMPNVHMLLGNHEYMMMDALGFPYGEEENFKGKASYDARRIWYKNGGKVTHRRWKRLSQSAKSDIMDYLRSLPLNMELEANGEKFRLVHGTSTEVYDAFQDAIDENRAFFCVWDRGTVLDMWDDGEVTTVFGHTPTVHFQDSEPMRIFRYGNLIGIDCGSGVSVEGGKNPFHGRLACLRLDDMAEFYSEAS